MTSPEQHTHETLRMISVVLPVYNEAANIVPGLRKISAALAGHEHEILICYDFDGDTTLPAVAAMTAKPATVRLVRNNLGRGVAFALKAGFLAARGDVVVVSMADLSDPPESIPAMAEKIRAGNAVVSGSRYMRGGSQHGGPLFKRTLSRLAGVSLRYYAGVNTHDATNNFRAYSAEFLRKTPVESAAGFEVAIELTTKAHLAGYRIDEIPSSWHDRTAGESRFNLRKWLPKYLYWYGRAMAAPLAVWSALTATLLVWILLIRQFGTNWPVLDELSYLSYTAGEKPITFAMLWQDHNGHRIFLPKLVYFWLMQLTHVQPAVIMYLGVFLLAGGTVALLLAVRKVRRRMAWTDAVIPLAVMALSQHENMLWAFQLAFQMSEALVLVALAAALGLGGPGTRWRLLVIALVASLMTLCGGQGMSMAPAFAAGLFLFGVMRLIRRTPGEAGVGLIALAGGMLSGLMWYLSVRGLPPPPGSAAVHEAFTSWSAFQSLVATILRAGTEFFSTAFLPGAMDTQTWFYRGAVWGAVGYGLLFASLVLLAWRWATRPAQRPLVGALVMGFGGFLLLTLSVGINRGIYGPGAGAVPRYATLAIPLLVLALLTFTLLGPRLLQILVPVFIGAALLALIPGGHGLAHLVHKHGAQARDSYNAFKREIAATPAPTIEELTGHYSAILFAPGDVRLVPGFIETLARNHLGPFRHSTLLPGHVAGWDAAPATFRVLEPHAVTWPTPTHGITADGGAHFILDLSPPRYVGALRMTFKIKSLHDQPPLMQIWWYQQGVNTADTNTRSLRWNPQSSEQSVTMTGYMFTTVDRLYVMPDIGPCDFELEKIEILTPQPTP